MTGASTSPRSPRSGAAGASSAPGCWNASARRSARPSSPRCSWTRTWPRSWAAPRTAGVASSPARRRAACPCRASRPPCPTTTRSAAIGCRPRWCRVCATSSGRTPTGGSTATASSTPTGPATAPSPAADRPGHGGSAGGAPYGVGLVHGQRLLGRRGGATEAGRDERQLVAAEPRVGLLGGVQQRRDAAAQLEVRLVGVVLAGHPQGLADAERDRDVGPAQPFGVVLGPHPLRPPDRHRDQRDRKSVV